MNHQRRVIRVIGVTIVIAAMASSFAYHAAVAAVSFTEHPNTGASPSPSFPVDIASGTDGALWFTEPVSNSIGRMTLDGVMTNRYALGGGSVQDIARGPTFAGVLIQGSDSVRIVP